MRFEYIFIVSVILFRYFKVSGWRNCTEIHIFNLCYKLYIIVKEIGQC